MNPTSNTGLSPETALRIALTPGDPSGIGPDLCLMLAQQPQPVELVAICDPELLQARARALQLPFTWRPCDPATQPAPPAAG